MSTAAKDLDLSVLPPEYRAVFEAQAARVTELQEINQRQEHLIHCPAVHSEGMSREGPSYTTRFTARSPKS